MTPHAVAHGNRQAVNFTPEERQAHAALKPGLLAFIWSSSPLSVLALPIIYSALVPFVILDAWTTAYQWICLPMFGIPRVRRRDYLVIDRHKLGYLNAIEKVHCMYCSYVNGVVGYVREIAARTEQYWCPIKHSRPIPAPHDRYHLFVGYGDGRAYRQELDGLRRALTADSSQQKPNERVNE